MGLEMEIDKIDDVKTPVCGLSKSGRWWKKKQNQSLRHTAIIKVKSLKSNSVKNKKERLQKQLVKAKETEIRESLAAERIARRQEQKEREERRKANIKKGEVVQVIKNTKKLMYNKNKKKIKNVETRDTN